MKKVRYLYISIILLFISIILVACDKDNKTASKAGYNFELIKNENTSEGQKHIWRITTDSGNSVYESNTITAIGNEKIMYKERSYTYVFEDNTGENYKVTITYPSGKKLVTVNTDGVITKNWENNIDDSDEELKSDLLIALILVNEDSLVTYRPQIAFFVFIFGVGFLIVGLFELVTSLFKWNLDFDKKSVSGVESLSDSKKRKIKAIIECIIGIVLYIISNII